jgi:hypothetical protein
MTMRTGTHIGWVGASIAILGAGALAVAGCATAPPPAPPVTVAAVPPPGPPPLPDLTFRAGEPPWGAMALSVVLAAPAAFETSLDALSRDIGLGEPIGRALVEGLGRAPQRLHGVAVDRALLDGLDPVLPVVFVTLAPGLGVKGGSCWGLAFRAPEDARHALDIAGVETARAGGESTRLLPDGTTVHAGVHGRTLLLSTTPRQIAVAGGLVEALQARPVEHLATAAVYPQVMPVGVGLMGTMFERWLTAVLRRAQAASASAPAKSPAAKITLTDGIINAFGVAARLAGGVVADTRTARLEIDLDPRLGVTARLVIEPAAGSALARTLAVTKPFRLDPRLRAFAASAFVASGGAVDGSGAAGEFLDASGPAGKKLHADFATWARLFPSPTSCAINLGLASTTVCTHEPGLAAKPGVAARAWVALTKDSMAWAREGGWSSQMPEPKVKISGDLLETEIDTDRPNDSPVVRARRHERLGGSIRRTVTVLRPADGLEVIGPDRRATAAALDALAKPSGPHRELDAILERAGGADLVAVLDLASLSTDVSFEIANEPLRRALDASVNDPGLAVERALVVFTARTGDRATYELAVPLETLRAVAALARELRATRDGP